METVQPAPETRLATLADLLRELDRLLSPEQKAEISALAKVDLYQLHFGVNALIRSLAYYRNASPEGKAEFESLGLPDEGSAVLGRIYWLHLRHEPITAHSLVPVIEENTIFVLGEHARSMAERFARSYSSVSS